MSDDILGFDDIYTEDIERLIKERDEARAEIKRLKSQVKGMKELLGDTLSNIEHFTDDFRQQVFSYGKDSSGE